MREATKPIMLLAALAFVGLMVFEWGMDLSGRSSGGLGEIGSVNGDPVMYEAYMAMYRRLYDQVQSSQEEMVSSQQNRDIEDAAFDQVVNRILIQQELSRRGITVTDQEIRNEAQTRPPSELIPQFVDAAGGLDVASYQSFLASLPPDQLLILESIYRDQIPREKLFRQVSSGIFLSDAELWQQYRDDNERVEVRYIPMDPASRYAAEDFTISDEEIEAYYDAHQEEFEVPARASIVAVVLGKAPTAADTVASEERASAILQEIRDGADFAEVATRESADEATAPAGGDLGVFPKDFMVPEFDAAVFEASSGSLVGPVKTSFGFHVIEVQERWAADSARARHVLVPIQRTDDSEIELLTLADSLEDLGEAMPLEAAAGELGLQANTYDLSQDFPFVVGAGQVSEGADWVFEEASPGDVSPVFETTTAFYALELVSSQPAGVLPLQDVVPAIESTLLSERRMERAREEAQRALERIRAGEALVNVAADMDLEVRDAGPFSRTEFVPGLGRQNAAIGAAFGLEVGEISDVVTTPINTFIIESMGRTAADSTAWRGQLETQRRTAVLVLRQQRLQAWLEALRSAARIVDRRDEVLQPADPDATVPSFPTVF